MDEQCPFVGPLSETDFIANMTINEFKKNTNVLQILIKELLERIPKRFEKEIARADFYIEQAFSQYLSNVPSRFTKFKRIRYISKSPMNLETDKGFLNPNPSMLGTSVKRNAIKSALKRCFKFEPKSISLDDFLEYSNIVLLLRNKFNDRYQTGVYTLNVEMLTKRIYDEFLIRRNTFPPDLKFKAEYIYWSCIPQRYQMYFDKNMRPKTESDNNCDTKNLETSETLNMNNINKPIAESFDLEINENFTGKLKEHSSVVPTEDKVTSIMVSENISLPESHATKRNATENDLSHTSKKLRFSPSRSSTDKKNVDEEQLQSENDLEMFESASHSSEEMVIESADDLSNASSYDSDVQIIEYVEDPSSPIIYEITELQDELVSCSPLDQTLIQHPKSLHDLGVLEVNESVIGDEYLNNDCVSVIIEKELVLKQEPIYSQIDIINVPWATTDVIEIEINDDSDEDSNEIFLQNENRMKIVFQ